MTLLLPVGLDIATCRVELAEVVVEDLGDGRARLPSGRVLSRSEVWAAWSGEGSVAEGVTMGRML